MDEKLQYQFDYKDIKDRLFTGVPVVAYIGLFVFSLLYQLIDVQFDLTIILTGSFWIKLSIKYFTIILVFTLLYPVFLNKLKESDESKKLKDEAENTNNSVVNKRLSYDLKVYTREEMTKEEELFFKDLLNSCGNIDIKYLDKEWNLKVIKKELEQESINKEQYKLLKAIKEGKIKFAKLKGDEIKYISAGYSKKHIKYKNRSASIVKNEFFVKIIAIFILAILTDMILNSLFDQQINFAEDWVKALLSLLTTAVNYSTSTFFAFSVANKVNEEWQRFTQVVTVFVKGFLEDVENKKYIPLNQREEKNNITELAKEE